ncbi:MAG: dCMP deaminase family protein [Clostridia bacterium]|nr:dCMP deaminase family protein [Clostridia bacterium]
MKRDNYLSWDEYFMGIALLSSQRSKDPSTQVGACIVDDNNKIMSVGYNGMPLHCSDDSFPWDNTGGALESKYFFVCHAELNAILNFRGGTLAGSKVYTTLFPCNECAKAIIQAGIKEVIFMCDKYAATESVIAAKRMFDVAQVKYRQYEQTKNTVELKL